VNPLSFSADGARVFYIFKGALAMPYTLVHQGVIRDFDFYAPPGWQHWVGKAWERRIGLPLVVVVHAGAQDPLGFQS